MTIEVDGNSHNLDEVLDKDVVRQKRLDNLGVKFLRFDDEEVKNNIDNVTKTIAFWINSNN